ncbi:DUF5004 domain-containing protein [Muricauda sp. SCSIO 64092]|uniref:lipocalin family protein n=1 Tax=Allomuricauda sp. SCSIO 64092 TaxID=2908842 RepID=UPI001FF39C72|nr:DUF5004 domain-containing protein [Muricauda sp. SCSIO 64092]UOY07226.1 DUF5004 domain-containing protein [Muricauda sp. SCSIO 64092]
MKKIPQKRNWTILLLSILCISVISCENDDDPKNNTETEHAATKQALIGEWKLISSTIDGEAVGLEDFSYLKESTATFNADNTYELVYRRRNGNLAATSILSGTYTVEGINSVTFFNSTSKIELVDDALQITSTTEDNKTQVDIFIKADNEELANDGESNGDIIGDENDNSDPPSSSFDGSEIISQIQGVWEITGVTDECQKKNTLEFVGSDEVIFTQHKETFNRNDLLKYNVSVTYPLQSDFSAVVTEGFNTITFDSNADCQFKKESDLSYLVEDAETIRIEESSRLTFKIIDDSTINLVYEYEDDDSNVQTIEYVYIKT